MTGDAQGDVYFGDSFTNRIRKITASGVISTLAGTGSGGFGGDGGPATEAALNWPLAITVAPDGAVVFADAGNARVPRVGTDGFVSTIAGGGTFGDGTNGDGGPATRAQLKVPSAVAFDAVGNLYIADQQDDRIRMVTTDGTITTYAQTGFPRGMAVAGDGSVLVTYGNTVRRINSAGIATTFAGENASYGGFEGDGGPATAAALDDPRDIAVDKGGNVYIADSGNKRVRRVSTDGTITTVAGNGTASYGGDGGRAVAAQMGAPDSVRSAPDGGRAVAAQMGAPDTVRSAPDGGLYIADPAQARVRHVDPAGVITTVRESQALGLAVDGRGYLYISENGRVVKRAPDGSVTVVAGTGGVGHDGDGGPATAARLTPTALAFDGSGNLYIGDVGNDYSLVRRVNPAGLITTVAGADATVQDSRSPELGRQTLIDIRDMAVGLDGALYVLGRRGVVRLRCGIVADAPVGSSINWDRLGYGPRGLVFDSAGFMFVTSGARVYKVAPDGNTTTVAGGGSARNGEGIPPTAAELSTWMNDVALDGAGNLYVTNRDRVLKISGVAAGAARAGPSCDSPPDRPVWGTGWNGLGALGDDSSPGRTAARQ